MDLVPGNAYLEKSIETGETIERNSRPEDANGAENPEGGSVSRAGKKREETEVHAVDLLGKFDVVRLAFVVTV